MATAQIRWSSRRLPLSTPPSTTTRTPRASTPRCRSRARMSWPLRSVRASSRTSTPRPMTLPDQLHGEGLVGKPTMFATNTLVWRSRGLADRLARRPDQAGYDDRDGRPTVPVGSYTREVLGRLPADQRKAILDNVRSEEPDVSGISASSPRGRRRGLRLRHRRDRQRWSAEGDSAAGRAATERRVRRRGRHRREEPRRRPQVHRRAAHGDGAAALEEAGFKPPPGVRRAAFGWRSSSPCSWCSPS